MGCGACESKAVGWVEVLSGLADRFEHRSANRSHTHTHRRGTASLHAAPSRHLRFCRARLQEVGCLRLLQRYRAQHDGEARYLAIDYVQAGLHPPSRQRHTRWVGMLAHFNEGRRVYGAEDGACGGFPHPGDDGIRQAYTRLTKEEKEEHTCRSKEGTLRAAIDKRLHAFWTSSPRPCPSGYSTAAPTPSGGARLTINSAILDP